MYLYLDQLNFSNRGGSISVKNLSINIQFFDDDSCKEKPLSLLFGRSREDPFVASQWSSVQYHIKHPLFYDEFKIRLPILEKKHHFLFTFYQVNVQSSKTSTSPQILGYAWLPLLSSSEDRTIISGEINLPVSTEIAPGYLSNPESFKLVDSGKKIFKVRIHVESSIYATDPFLHEYFSHLPGVTTSQIKNLVKVSPHQLAQFAPILLNQLLKIIAKQDQKINKQAFITLLLLLHSVHTTSVDTIDTLEGYIAYVHREKFQGKIAPLYQVLTDLLNNQLEERDKLIVEKIAKYGWFFLKVIFKSLALAMHSKKILNSPEPRNNPQRVDPEFIISFEKLIFQLTNEIQLRSKTGFNISKELNKTLAKFLRDSFLVLDRGSSFQMIDKAIHKIAYTLNTSLIEFKFDFLQIISDFPDFVPLNVPTTHVSLSGLNLLEGWSEKHFLIGIVLRQIDNYLFSSDANIRNKAISFLQQHLHRYDIDPRYSGAKIKSMITEMYFPLVTTIIHNLEMIKHSLNPEEKRSVLSPLLWILRNIRPDLLSQWWGSQTYGTAAVFESLFECMSNCLSQILIKTIPSLCAYQKTVSTHFFYPK